MGWLKVDDKMPRNPKILAGDIETAWYYACALTHAAEQLTDGFIARSAVPLVAPHIADPCSVAERCADLDLFRRVEGGYEVPDYLEYNPSRAETITKRAKEAERKRSSRAESQRDSAQTSGVTPGVPSRPVPTTGVTPSSSTATAGGVLSEAGERVLAGLADHKRRGATSVRSESRWRSKVIATDRVEHGAEIERLVSTYPDAPVSLLVASVLGEDARNLNHYRKPKEAS